MKRPISLPASIKDLYDRAEAAIQELQSIRNDIRTIQGAQGNAPDVVRTENGKIPERYLPSGVKPLPSWLAIDNIRSSTAYGGVYPTVNAGRRALNWYTNVADWNFDTDITLVNGARVRGTASNADQVYGYDFPTLKSKVLEGVNLNGTPGAGTVNTEAIINNSITTNKLVNNSITTEKLQNNSISTEKIKDGAITNIKLAPNSVNTNNIVDNSITEAKLTDNSVTRNKIVRNIDLRGPNVSIDGKKVATEEYVLAHQGGGGSGLPDWIKPMQEPGGNHNLTIRNQPEWISLNAPGTGFCIFWDNANSLIFYPNKIVSLTNIELQNDSLRFVGTATNSEKVFGYNLDGLKTKILEGLTPGNSFQLTDNCIETKHIKDNAIVAAKIAVNAVTTNALSSQSVTNTKLVDGAVSTNKLANDSVSSPKIPIDIELRGSNVRANGGKIATETFVNDQLNSKLNLTGGTLTGPLTVQKLVVGNLEVSVE